MNKDDGAGGSGETPEAKEAREKQEANDKLAADKTETERLSKLTAEELIKENAALKVENAERRVKGKKLAEKQEADDKAAEEAKRKEAEEAGKHEELYNTELAEHETTKTERNQYKAALEVFFDAETKDLPANIKALMPSGIVEGLEWLVKAKSTSPEWFGGDGGPGVKLPGNEQDPSFQEKYDGLMKDNKLSEAMALKRQHFESQQK